MEQQHSSDKNQISYPLIPTGFGTFIALFLLICFIAILCLWRPWQPVDVQQREISNIATANQDDKKTTHYEFYDLLAKQQVAPVPEKPVATNTAHDSMPSHAVIEVDGKTFQPYVLIINSFQNADLADELQGKLQVAGFLSDVIIEADTNGQVLYRVVAGPFNGKQQAEIAQKNLKQQGIDSVLSEVSRTKTE